MSEDKDEKAAGRIEVLLWVIVGMLIAHVFFT